MTEDEKKAFWDDQLMAAAEGGDAAGVRAALISGGDPGVKDGAPLLWAARNGHVECVRMLIPVSEPLARNSIAFRMAAGHGHARCVELLLPVSEPAEGSAALLGEAAEQARERRHGEVATMIDAFIEGKAIGGAAQAVGVRKKKRSSL